MIFILKNISFSVILYFLCILWYNPNVIKISGETMQIEYFSLKCGRRLRLIITADFHSRKSSNQHKNTLGLIEKLKPDVILCPGDILNHTDSESVDSAENINGFNFLTSMCETAPVIYSIGNHEHSINEKNKKMLTDCGVIVLDNSVIELFGIIFGGLSSGYVKNKTEYITPPSPDLSFIKHFSEMEGFKILLSHHPEYFTKYIAGNGIDITVSGHAHGGQWRFFSRGVYAPGQGLFPKYTAGLHTFGNEKLVISRGMTNTVPIPRFFNRCELVVLDLEE